MAKSKEKEVSNSASEIWYRIVLDLEYDANAEHWHSVQ